MTFPDDFLWGAATSAYQIEGSPLADGAGPSIWHRFAHTPGNTLDGETGDVACDHYRRWEADLDLMVDLGLTLYRFSMAWARVLPEGTGRVNEAGLDFYERLVDGLLERGIAPMLTLYHWDLPAALDDRGGWLNRDSAEWFGEYAAVVARRLGDRVPRWLTLNEPWVVMDGGYVRGGLAPGHRNRFEGPLVAHHLLRAHGRGAQALRAELSSGTDVGIAINVEPKVPADDRPETLRTVARADAYMNRIFLDPLVHGRYPDELADLFGDAWPDFSAPTYDGDFDLIRQPLDLLGLNYYTRAVVDTDEEAYPDYARTVRQPRHAYTEMGWEVFPPALTGTLVWLRERYGALPIFVTENGAAYYDPPQAEAGADGRGTVDDPLRIAYYRSHLRAIHDAIRQGVDVRGYCAWSFLDNYEWSFGYSKRFGIVHVDFETQQRTPKASAHFYSRVIETNGAALGARASQSAEETKEVAR